jgi:phosphotriesterase-related protein
MFVQTVLGPVPASKLGVTLVHEHVMYDFIGADQTNRHRWEVEAVVKRMLPLLRVLEESGVTGFIDCTSAYIGRDPRVLKQLAQETGLHIVTNTGYYGGADDKGAPLRPTVIS